MKLLSIGYNHLHDESFEVNRPNGIGSWLFLLIQSPAIFNYGGKEYQVHANSFVVFSAGFPHCYRAFHQAYIDDWFHFMVSEDDISFIRSIRLPLNAVIPLVDITHLTSLIRNMTYVINSEHIHKTNVVELHFKLLLYKISQLLTNGKTCYPVKEKCIIGYY